FATCVVYLYSAAKRLLVAEHVSGANIDAFKNLTMELGENLSGHVALVRQPAHNVDPSPELDGIRQRLQVQIDNALVYPLQADQKCLGTISLYTSPGVRFNDDHVRVMETVSRQAAVAIQNAIKFEETQEDAFTDALTGLPNSRYLRLHFERELQK